MDAKMVSSLAEVLGGEPSTLMPSSRAPGVFVAREDGTFAAIEGHGGWVYRDRSAFDDYQRTGDSEAVLDSREWLDWGVTEEWASSLAAVIGGEAHQSGGNIWVVLYRRPDGRFIVLGDDGAEIYESAEHYEHYYDGDQPEPRGQKRTEKGTLLVFAILGYGRGLARSGDRKGDITGDRKGDITGFRHPRVRPRACEVGLGLGV